MWLFSTRCKSNARLDNKTAIVTGCNTGIGKATVLELVRRGARVLMACRDVKKAEAALEEIRCQTRDLPGAGVAVVVHLDLASLASVRKCAQHILETEDQIHLLINNAGVCFSPESYTEDGFEMQMGVNHFGHFLLTCLLLPRLISSAPARIINVSSKGSYMASRSFIGQLKGKKACYNAWIAYGESKLANILFTAELARRLQGTGVTTYAVHPGFVLTEGDRWFSSATRGFYRNTIGYFCKTPEEGAQTTIYCAVDEKTGKETGHFYAECKKIGGPRLGKDEELALKLWEKSVYLLELGDWDPFTASNNKTSLDHELQNLS